MTRSYKLMFKLFFIVWLPFASGCGIATLTVAGASLGVTYTMSNIAYKTFNFSLGDVDAATYQALKKLDFRIVDHKDLGGKKTFRSAAKDRDIRISLESITPATTQMSVDARKWPFFKDKATAVEIIYQVFKILDPEAVSEVGVT